MREGRAVGERIGNEASGRCEPAVTPSVHAQTTLPIGTSCRYAPVEVVSTNGIAASPGEFADVVAEDIRDARIVGRL